MMSGRREEARGGNIEKHNRTSEKTVLCRVQARDNGRCALLWKMKCNEVSAQYFKARKTQCVKMCER